MPTHAPIPEVSQRELDEARIELLRKRVTTFGTTLGVLVLGLASVQAAFAFGVLHAPRDQALVRVGLTVLLGLALIVIPRLRRARFSRLTLGALVLRINWLVIMSVLSQIQGARVIAEGVTALLRETGFTGQLGAMLPLAVFLLCVHTAAAVIVPWTLRESLIAPAVLAVVNLGAGDDSAAMLVVGVMLTLAAGAPGVAIALLRSGSLRETLALRLIGDRYAEVSRELSTARRIHEKLFPPPIDEGSFRMTYRYEPMRQIGGDYLYAVRHTDGSLSVAMVDVTGHGISAALAVNRLHGEMKRLYAQGDGVGPGEVVAGLNEYVCLTLADERVFATAAAVRIGPDGRCRLAIAGHPPALVRRSDGSIDQLDTTAMMLGVLGGEEYECDEAAALLAPGDALVLYTDGAPESLNEGGRQLGVDGLRAAIGPAGGGLNGCIRAIFEAVERHRAGPAEDDTLVVALGLAER